MYRFFQYFQCLVAPLFSNLEELCIEPFLLYDSIAAKKILYKICMNSKLKVLRSVTCHISVTKIMARFFQCATVQQLFLCLGELYTESFFVVSSKTAMKKILYKICITSKLKAPCDLKYNKTDHRVIKCQCLVAPSFSSVDAFCMFYGSTAT